MPKCEIEGKRHMEDMIDEVVSVTGAAVDGRMLAVTTIVETGPLLAISNSRSRQFHLAEARQEDVLAFGREVHEFLREVRIHKVAFCRTTTVLGEGGNYYENKVETVLQMIPKLELEVLDNDVIAEWRLREDPAFPAGDAHYRESLQQTRAIEAALFHLAKHPRSLPETPALLCSSVADEPDQQIAPSIGADELEVVERFLQILKQFQGPARA
jgi:hypothetical protein